MLWVLGCVIFVLVGAVLRAMLGLSFNRKSRSGGRVSMRPECDAIYHSLAREIEAHSIILGITLNDAFNEREGNRTDMAWLVVGLANGEWDRLKNLVAGLQRTLAHHLPTTGTVVPVRAVTAGNFKSRVVNDYVALYEFLDQILFSSKQRFGLRLRVLSRACALLTKEFRHVYHEGERAQDADLEVWNRLDCYFHDFDLLAKETLLTFQTLLACQSPEGIRRMAIEVEELLQQGVRVSVPTTAD